MQQLQSFHATWQVFLTFLRLGLTSFGGPVAHLGYFHHEFVERKKWLTEQEYADLVALCQFLPGPASSQVGMGIGLMRSGYLGLVAAWVGFTLPSALVLILFALGAVHFQEIIPAGLLHGLKVASVAIVVQAVWGMMKMFCKDQKQIAIMVFATTVVLLFPSAWVQVLVIVLAAFISLAWLPQPQVSQTSSSSTGSQKMALFSLGLFFILLVGLPLLAYHGSSHYLAMIDAFYRSGALVFGGGHVVLPLLQTETVSTGWVSDDLFLAGYALAQTVPGPLFTFAAFLGAADQGWLGGVVALLAIFLPSALLVLGALPFWATLRTNPLAQKALVGVNSAVVGLLLAALYNPIWINAILHPKDFCLALIAFVALMFWKLPAWLVIVASGAISAIFYTF